MSYSGKLANIKYPCFAEIKYDGEYCTWAGGVFTNKYANVKMLPHLNTELLGVNEILAGELYYGDGKDGALYQLLANKNSPDLKFAVFDLSSGLMSYRERREKLLEVLKPTEHVHIAETEFIENKAELLSFFEYATLEGYEGMVVKNADSMSSTHWMKMKVKRTADLTVLDISQTQERIVVEVPIRVGKKGGTVPCGVKCVNKYKNTLKVGDIVEIEYQCQLPSGSLRHPVYKRKRNPAKEVSLE